jgi:mycofactocin radical SAM maturase
MLRRDFFEILHHAAAHDVGVKFSTNGTYIDAVAARRLAAMDYLDIQISLDGADSDVNDLIRGEGSHAAALAAMENLADADFGPFKISVVVTRENVDQLDDFRALADSYGAQLRITRLRPSGRGADTWDRLHPTQQQQRQLYHWLLDRPDVLTGDSFFHLSALGTELPGLNLCGAGRVVCLIDPIGDVYACPFVIHDEFLAGNLRDPGGFTKIWRESDLFTSLREPDSPGACASCGSYDACQGGCMASKFFVGLDLTDPDPECVHGHADDLLAELAAGRGIDSGGREKGLPRPSQDHSRPGVPVPVAVKLRR